MADSIAQWLDKLGLGQYTQAFADNKVELDHLPDLTDDDLKELGLPLGPRRHLQAALRTLSADQPPDRPGMPIANAAEKRLSDAERRQLTVMFIDLVGSTALSGRLDPEDMRDAITSYQNTVAGVVTRYDGHIAKYMGDGVLCYFGWPRAHEDDAERAVRAGLAVNQGLSGLAATNGEALSARIGIATGLVVVGDLIGEGAAQEEAVVGETPNLSARLQALAEPGQVVLAEATQRLLGNTFDLSSLGPQSLKGIAQPVHAFAVRGEAVAETRFAARQTETPSSLVGREQELALLADRWRHAKGGEGQMVLLTGEAGIGKSRISRAMLDSLSDETCFRIIYQCSPYHGDSALYPAIQQLTRSAGIQSEDGPDTRLDKLEALLALSSDDISQALPLVAALLDIEAEGRYGPLNLSAAQQRARTFAVLIEQLLGLARQAPVLVLIEDAHWIDPTTMELIEQILSRIENERVLLLITARPTFHHAIAAHPIATRLALNRMGREQSLAIVKRVARGKDLPAAVLDEIVHRTDGVPLFVEELTKTLLESGKLRETATAFELVGSLDDLEIPSSLHDSLMARLDRLQPVKEVAQMAACIGREFSFRLLAAISPLSEETLYDSLEKLIAAELLFRRGTSPNVSYIFKHALVRDAAYESLLKSKRQALHAALVSALQKDSAAAPEIIAYHATEAGLVEEAVANWLKAGKLANERSAFAEAIGHLEKGLEVLGNEPPSPIRAQQEIEFHSALGSAMISVHGYGAPEVEENFKRALKLCAEFGDASQRFVALHGMWWFQFTAQSVEQSRQTGLELRALASETGQVELEIAAHRAYGYSCWVTGDFETGFAEFERGGALYDPDRHRPLASRLGGAEPGVGLNSLGSNCAWCLGWPDRALDISQRNLPLIEKLNLPITECWARVNLAQVNQFRGSPDAVRREAGRVLEIAKELSYPLYIGWALPLYGWSMIGQATGPEDEDAVSLIRKGIQTSDKTGTIVQGTTWRVLLAQACLEAGEFAEGLAALDEADALAARNDERFCAAELLRLRGRLRLARSRDEAPDAERLFQEAIATARQQRAKSWELRASTSLASLWADAGERRKALDLLAPVYGWFTEGFETADLIAAKTLLDELA